MTRSSSGAVPIARQEQGATPANLRSWKGHADRISSLLQVNLAHGLKKVLGDVVGLKPYQLSRQLSGVERLTIGVVDAGVGLLEQEKGSEAVVAEIRALMSTGGRIARLDPVTFVYDPLKGTLEWGVRR